VDRGRPTGVAPGASPGLGMMGGVHGERGRGRVVAAAVVGPRPAGALVGITRGRPARNSICSTPLLPRTRTRVFSMASIRKPLMRSPSARTLPLMTASWPPVWRQIARRLRRSAARGPFGGGRGRFVDRERVPAGGFHPARQVGFDVRDVDGILGNDPGRGVRVRTVGAGGIRDGARLRGRCDGGDGARGGQTGLDPLAEDGPDGEHEGAGRHDGDDDRLGLLFHGVGG
jgi:hypothetical protein